jgi:glyoxylase-like metal-dependent hydrolase (beta-lactamase superfamily II)
MSDQFTLSIDEFKKRLDNRSIEFILDMRLPDEFESWRIEGHYDVETINIPQVDFVGEENKFFDQLPRDKEIIIVCAHGEASGYAAEILHKNGFNALGLEGGMDAWAELYELHKVAVSPDIYQIYRVAKGCISHVLISGGQAIVIDAVRHTEKICSIIDSNNAELVAVLDTHLQADHISGGRRIAEKYNAPYFINPTDVEGAQYSYQPLQDGATIQFGSSILEILFSPGHTPGSTSFLLDKKYLFPGDTIMKNSVGRPDLGGMVVEWATLLYDTLFHKYSPLGNDIILLPTHAASIREEDSEGFVRLTLADARQQLPLFQKKDQEEFTSYISSTLLENPDRYQDIRKVNLGLLDPDEKKQQELEIGKNLCGMAPKES